MKIRIPALVILGLAAAASLGAGSSNSSAPLTQAGWASLLADRMLITKHLSATVASEQAMALLGTRATTIDRPPTSAQLIQADAAQKTWRYDFVTPVTATWLLTTENSTPAFVSVDKLPSALTPAATNGAVDSGRYSLLAGPHSISIHVAQNIASPKLSLVGSCSVVAPPGGWQGTAPLIYGVLGDLPPRRL